MGRRRAKHSSTILPVPPKAGLFPASPEREGVAGNTEEACDAWTAGWGADDLLERWVCLLRAQTMPCIHRDLGELQRCAGEQGKK